PACRSGIASRQLAGAAGFRDVLLRTLDKLPAGMAEGSCFVRTIAPWCIQELRLRHRAYVRRSDKTAKRLKMKAQHNHAAELEHVRNMEGGILVRPHQLLS